MSNLNCKSSKCIYNHSGLCNADYINVSGKYAHSSNETCCNTFKEGSIKNTFNTLNNIGIFNGVKQIFSDNTQGLRKEIYCDASNCYHNNNGVCKAENVLVSGSKARTLDETNCETFIEGY